MDKKTKRTIVMLVCIVGLVFFSMVLGVIDIPLPFLPSTAKLQFSSVLELLGAIAYGPFVGAFIALAKSFFYFWLTGCNFGELVSILIPDVVFVVLASIIYINIRGGVVKKTDKNGETIKKIVTRRKRILISGVVASLLSTLVSVAVTKFIQIPLMYRLTELSPESLLEEYSRVAGVTSIDMGILVINAPVVLFEYAIATLIIAILYKKVSRFMHGKTVS